jgi:outer membrane protein assembly factor BamB/predicted phosphodiesterase
LAVVSDTHASVGRGGSAERLDLVFGAIARLEPDLVVHCGDITDTGLPEEYDLYRRVLPAALAGRVRHVPGNHEVRWDGTAKGLYRSNFGAPRWSLAVGGVCWVGLDPTQVLQEPGHYGREGLGWLRRVLGRVAEGVPVILFQHFPVGEDHRDVEDQRALLDLIARHDVRGIFAGHVHREEVSRVGGVTQVTLRAVLDAPVFYWAEADRREGASVLEVSRVTVAADGTQDRVAVTTIPLSGDGAGRVLRTDGSGGGDALAGSADPVPGWRFRLAGSVQGGIAVAGEVIVAGSTGGEVVGFRVARGAAEADPAGGYDRIRLMGSALRRVWRVRVGAVYRQAGVDAAGHTVFVPSADGHLYALDAGTGRIEWRFEAGAPVLSAPLATGAGVVVFTAGARLLAVDAATGGLVWYVPGRGFSAGRAACDGERVYTCAGDGYARAHDAGTGRQVWAHQMVAGDRHRVALYSGWDDVVVLGSGVVIVATVSGSVALEAATGAPRWTFPGGTMYPPAVVLGDGTVLLTTEYGVVARVSLSDGGVRWRTDLGVRVLNAGLAADGERAWVMSAHGRLIGVRLADGRQLGSVRHTRACCYSAPVIVGGVLIAGDQDGFVHGIALPPASGLAAPGAPRRQQRYGRDLLLGQVLPADARGRPRAAHPAAVDHPVGGDDEVQRYVVAGERDRAGRPDLEFVRGGDGHGVRSDQARDGGEGELQVGEPAALAEPGSVLPRGHAAHDHQVDRVEFGQRDPAGGPGRAADRGGLAGRLAEVVGIEGEERLRLGKPRHGHVHGLAVLQGTLADRQLRGVRVGLEGAGRLPLRHGAQAFRGGLGAGEVRDAPGRAREPCHLRRGHRGPDLLAQGGLGGQQLGGAAGIAVVAGSGAGHGTHCAVAPARVWRPVPGCSAPGSGCSRSRARCSQPPIRWPIRLPGGCRGRR